MTDHVNGFTKLTDRERLMGKREWLRKQTPETMPDQERVEREIKLIDWLLENFDEIESLRPYQLKKWINNGGGR